MEAERKTGDKGEYYDGKRIGGRHGAGGEREIGLVDTVERDIGELVQTDDEDVEEKRGRERRR